MSESDLGLEHRDKFASGKMTIEYDNHIPLFKTSIPGVGKIEIYKPTYIPEEKLDHDEPERGTGSVEFDLDQAEITHMVNGAQSVEAENPEAFEDWLIQEGIPYQESPLGKPHFDLLG